MTTITAHSPKPGIALRQQSRYYCDSSVQKLLRSKEQPQTVGCASLTPPLCSPRGLETLYVHSITSPPLAACLACLEELDLQARTEREREGGREIAPEREKGRVTQWPWDCSTFSLPTGTMSTHQAGKNKARLRG